MWRYLCYACQKKRQDKLLSGTELISRNARQVINTLESDKITHIPRGFNIIYSHWENSFSIKFMLIVMVSWTYLLMLNNTYMSWSNTFICLESSSKEIRLLHYYLNRVMRCSPALTQKIMLTPFSQRKSNGLNWQYVHLWI